MPVFYQLQDRQQQGKTLQNSITTPTLGAFQDWTVDNHLFWMHRRWAGNLKGEGGNILIGNKMEIIYSSSPRYPADFHPAGNKRSSFLTCPSPLLLQLSIPFDFMTKICKSETYISPEFLIFRLQVLKGGIGKVPAFNSTVGPFIVWEVWPGTACMSDYPCIINIYQCCFHWLFSRVVILCKILNLCQDRIANYSF